MKDKILKIIGNLLLILGGFYLIFSPSNTFSSIVYVIGLLLVIYGGIIVIYSLINRSNLMVFGNVLFSGCINILLGIILMVNKNGTIMMLSRLLGIWLIVKSLFSLSLYYGSNIKDKKMEYWNMHTYSNKVIDSSKISLLKVKNEYSASKILEQLVINNIQYVKQNLNFLYEYYNYFYN